MTEGPLRNVRVLDLGHAFAGPFAATLLADFGADVIKIERPGSGDGMRALGPAGETGPALWKTMARGKRCLALDWKNPKSRPVLEALVRAADVVVENFRPGVLERNGLGPDVLLAWNPDLIVLRISGFGQTGPYSARPGFGRAAEAFSGLTGLTGFPDGPPIFPGFAMGDMTTGLMGAYGVVMALLARKEGLSRGQVIDLPIYETPMRLVDYHVPVRTAADVRPNRNGHRQPLSYGLSGVFETRDGRWVTYSAVTDATARRVIRLIGGEEWVQDPRFRNLHEICRHYDAVDERMADWVKARTADEVVKAFEAAQAVAACIYDVEDILADPHIAARRNVVTVDGDPCRVVGVVPKLSATPGAVRWLGRELGADTVEILRDAGLDEETVQDLLQSGAASASGEASAR